jgi:hypothetical protein
MSLTPLPRPASEVLTDLHCRLRTDYLAKSQIFIRLINNATELGKQGHTMLKCCTGYLLVIDHSIA